MKFFKITALFAFLMFFSSIEARENSQPDHSKLEKLYIQINQLEIDATGIFVAIDGNLYRTSGLFYDAQGLYVVRDNWNSYCGNGHPSPDGYHCYNFGCKYYKAPDLDIE